MRRGRWVGGASMAALVAGAMSGARAEVQTARSEVAAVTFDPEGNLLGVTNLTGDALEMSVKVELVEGTFLHVAACDFKAEIAAHGTWSESLIGAAGSNDRCQLSVPHLPQLALRLTGTVDFERLVHVGSITLGDPAP